MHECTLSVAISFVLCFCRISMRRKHLVIHYTHYNPSIPLYSLFVVYNSIHVPAAVSPLFISSSFRLPMMICKNFIEWIPLRSSLKLHLFTQMDMDDIAILPLGNILLKCIKNSFSVQYVTNMHSTFIIRNIVNVAPLMQ